MYRRRRVLSKLKHLTGSRRLPGAYRTETDLRGSVWLPTRSLRVHSENAEKDQSATIGTGVAISELLYARYETYWPRKLKEDDLMAKPKLVTGLFKNRLAAEAAVDAILKRGYTRDDISVMMSDATHNKEFALQARTHAADGAGIGGALGGVVGAVLAAIVAVGSTIILPGLNLVIAGPIAAALAGAGAGAATGGVIGALIGAGIPEYRAKVYEAGLRGGGILLGVEAKSDEEVEKLEELLEAIGGEHVRSK
jgi:hypothetical protein